MKHFILTACACACVALVGASCDSGPGTRTSSGYVETTVEAYTANGPDIAGKVDQVYICHLGVNDETGSPQFTPIMIPNASRALENHLGHGDQFQFYPVPDMPGYVYNEECVPEEDVTPPECVVQAQTENSVTFLFMDDLGIFFAQIGMTGCFGPDDCVTSTDRLDPRHWVTTVQYNGVGESDIFGRVTDHALQETHCPDLTLYGPAA